MAQPAIRVTVDRETHLAIFEELKDILYEYNSQSVAESAGVATSTIYFWLDGQTRKPRLDTIVKVAAAVGYELRLVKVGKAMPRRRLVAVK